MTTTMRVDATIERLARPPLAAWPVRVTIQLPYVTRRGSDLTARVGTQWLEGVTAQASPPGLVGYLPRLPSQGDEIVLVDGMQSLPTGIVFGAPAAPAAQSARADDDVFAPPDDPEALRADAAGLEADYGDVSGAEALTASCSIRGATITCGTCSATEQRVSGAAAALVHVDPAHVYPGVSNDQLNDRAAQALADMRNAAIAAGVITSGSHYLKLVSGHRDYASQSGLWRGRMRSVFTTFGCTNWAQLDPVVQATSRALAGNAPPHAPDAWLRRFRAELSAAGVSPQGCVEANMRSAAQSENVRLPAGAIDPVWLAVAVGRKTVAPPGASPHHTGRAADIYIGSKQGFRGTSSAAENVAWQRRRPWFEWLVCNAATYGYHPYNREPWHWEYTPPSS